VAEPVSFAAYTAWTFPFWPAAGVLIAAVIYLRGWRRIRVTRPQQFPPARLGCFLGGLASIWIALASPIDSLDDVLLTAHMTQHLILMSVAPPLLLLGLPAVPLLRGLPRWLIRPVLGPLFRAPWLHQVFRVITHPVFAFMAMNIAYLGWHVPPAYELALRSDGWHDVEHACFFATSLLFWFPVIQPWPSLSRGSRWALLPYLVGTDLVNTALSAFLTFAGRVIYPSYAAAPRVFNMSAIDDQATAGALMWVIGSIFFLVPCALIASRLLSPQAGSAIRRVVPVQKAG
jgi:putative membrane protein